MTFFVRCLGLGVSILLRVWDEYWWSITYFVMMHNASRWSNLSLTRSWMRRGRNSSRVDTTLRAGNSHDLWGGSSTSSDRGDDGSSSNNNTATHYSVIFAFCFIHHWISSTQCIYTGRELVSHFCNRTSDKVLSIFTCTRFDFEHKSLNTSLHCTKIIQLVDKMSLHGH